MQDRQEPRSFFKEVLEEATSSPKEMSIILRSEFEDSPRGTKHWLQTSHDPIPTPTSGS